MPMSNKLHTSAILARNCLRALSRDLVDDGAKRAINTLDRYLRLCDYAGFCSSCTEIFANAVSSNLEPWQVRERCQVASLIRFPIQDLDDDAIVKAQRDRVGSLQTSFSWSDRQILRLAGERVSSVLSDALRHFEDDPHPPLRHGPGVTSESPDLLAKRKVVFVDPGVERTYGWAVPNHKWTSLSKFSCGPTLHEGKTRTIVVPKDHKTRRTIAAEPTWTQWVQQGLARCVVRRMEHDSRYVSHVAFKDQECQRNIIRRSWNGEYNTVGTIDLSDASDTIRLKHFLLLIKDLDLRSKVLALRTKTTVWNGIFLPTVGLFPMGSALCFPVETLIFTELLLSWCQCEVGRYPSRWGVFGDDITVDSYLAGGFSSFLRRCGFSPNLSKTYIGGDFIESCGLNLYRGIDVTPIKIKKPVPVSSTDVRNITWYEYAKKADRLALTNLSKFMASQCLFPFDHLHRWNYGYQRTEVLSLVGSSRCVSFRDSYPEALLNGTGDVPTGNITFHRGWLPLG